MVRRDEICSDTTRCRSGLNQDFPSLSMAQVLDTALRGVAMWSAPSGSTDRRLRSCVRQRLCHIRLSAASERALVCPKIGVFRRLLLISFTLLRPASCQKTVALAAVPRCCISNSTERQRAIATGRDRHHHTSHGPTDHQPNAMTKVTGIIKLFVSRMPVRGVGSVNIQGVRRGWRRIPASHRPGHRVIGRSALWNAVPQGTKPALDHRRNWFTGRCVQVCGWLSDGCET